MQPQKWVSMESCEMRRGYGAVGCFSITPAWGDNVGPMARIWEVLLQDTHPAVCWSQASVVKIAPSQPYGVRKVNGQVVGSSRALQSHRAETLPAEAQGLHMWRSCTSSA